MLMRTILMGILVMATSVNSAGATHVTVQGKVSFERRATVVPLTVCDNGRPCYESKPYWSMLIASETGKFELDQAFALGSHNEPDAVEMAGVTIRPGFQVEVEGRVERITRDYAIVSEVKNINVLEKGPSEVVSEVSTFIAAPDVLSPANSGWDCRSSELEYGRLRVHVRYEAGLHADESAEGFTIRVLEKSQDGLRFREVASIKSIEMRKTANGLRYVGGNPRASADLTIQHSSESIFDSPAWLTLTRAKDGQSDERYYTMRCTRAGL